MICNKCGGKVEKDTKFCVRCGSDLHQEGSTIQNSRQDAPQSEHSKQITHAFIFGLISVIFAFSTNFESAWYIILISLILKIAGFVFGLLALVITLRAPIARRGLALAAFILATIGTVICGIAMLSQLINMINSVAF